MGQMIVSLSFAKPGIRNAAISSLLAIILGGGLSGCALKPTRAVENPERKQDAAKAFQPVKVTAETAIVDARPPFEYSGAHVPRSVNFQWNDFTEPEQAQRGVLQGDLFGIARRLARAGISTETPVVVVGSGLKGGGEEGRMAWMFRYLGIKNVQFSDLDSMKFRLSNLPEENPLKSVAPWKPEIDESLNAPRAELLFVINQKGVFEPVVFKAGQPATLYRIIDVRSAANYLGREGIGAERSIPNMEAINIPWREFFAPTLRPRPEIASKLKDVGVLPEHRIIVLDEDGVASGAVAMALRSLGFLNTANFSGGLRDLMSAYPTSQ